MEIIVSRKGTIWYNDCYDIPEITEENIRKCIEDDSDFFVESEPLFETWTETGDIEVTNTDTGEILYDPKSREITIPNDEKD